jgi:hypothetical protein
MKRGAPLKRVPFKRRVRPEGPTVTREPRPMALSPSRSLVRGTYSGSTSGAPITKENPLQHLGYMAVVRDLGYCMRCRIPCRPQFCHRDMGKGGASKTDCREGWPGCDDCHALLGGHKGGGRMPKDRRRIEELDLGQRTRAAVKAAGTWPARLPMLVEEPDRSYAP